MFIQVGWPLNDRFNCTMASPLLKNDFVFSGEVVGCIELLASLEEDFDELFGKTPYECPGRPGEELNMSVIQLHMLR